jgi:hypothetical protein
MSHKYNERRYNNGFASYPFTQSISDSVTVADSTISKQPGKALSDSLSFTESLPKAVTSTRIETVTISETTGKDATAHFFDAVAPTDTKSAEPNHKLSDGVLTGDHLLTIEVEMSDTVRLEDWISLNLTKPGVWTETTPDSGSWTEASPSSDPGWTELPPPTSTSWSH